MNEKDFTIINMQLAVFFEKTLDNPEGLHLKLNEKLGNIFDQAPMVISIPKDNPELSMVPVVQMNSSDNYACNIAYARADFIKSGKGVQALDDMSNDFVDKSSGFVNIFLENNSRINRIGVITRYFVRSDSPDDKISKLLNKDFISLQCGSVVETHITNATRIVEDDGDEINVLLSLNRMSKNIFGVGSDLNGFEIMFDINTAPEKMSYYVEKINGEFVKSFIENNIERGNPNDIINLIYGNEKK